MNNMIVLAILLLIAGVIRIFLSSSKEKRLAISNGVTLSWVKLITENEKSLRRWRISKYTGYAYLGVAVVLGFLAIFSDINISNKAVLPIIIGCAFVSAVFIEIKSR